ncbi:MAG: iron ABC transporter substrate-binding protein [Chloroflexi bacterium]|nr:iron ABC transporter substrate-binding protein [Chloroflexota bacterium]
MGRVMVFLAALLVVIALGCTPAAPTAPPATPTVKTQTLTVYSGRAEGLVKPIIDQFSKSTGINVQVRYAGTSELAATILEEGKNSPADVFFAQDPGGLGAVESLLTRLPDSILDLVEPGFHPNEGRWVGISGRARVIAYNTQKVKESDLPDDIFGLTDPKWKGRIGWAPTNASFQAMVTAMRKLWGEEKTRQWLVGIQANNPKVYANNTAQVNAVGAGEIDVAMPNHYYLYGIMQDKGESFPVRNYHPRAGGPGAVILVAGAGILETSKNKEAAEKFVEFMLSPVAQQYFAGQTFEYPVTKGVKTHRLLTPLSDIKSPEISMSDMTDLKGTLDLLRGTGVVP